MNPHARMLGRMAKGKRKRLSREQREDLRRRLAKARKLRWKKKGGR